MKLYRLVGIALFIGSASLAQQRPKMAETDVSIAEADKEQVRRLFAGEIAKVKPNVSAEMLDRDSNVYIEALPDVQKTLRQKSCAGNACSSHVVNQGLLDVYLTTMDQKDYGLIGPGDIGETVAKTSFVSVWSNPPDADFKLLQGSTPIWVQKTNRERFILKGDYLLHIEKTGYEVFEATCSNNQDGGVLCGGPLKKKE
jgi:hypothetical protein